METRTEQVSPDKALKVFDIYNRYFRLFVRDILGLQNETFHDELDDDISQRFDVESPAYKMIHRFCAVFTYPRDHGKSKHLSVAYPLWRIAKDHNIRILAISRTANVAESFLSEIVSNIERNELYKEWATAIDPTGEGVIPRMKATRKQTEDWSGKSITIEREDIGMKDPTICATGLFGQILSRRADIIILDDVVDQQNSMTEGQRKKVIDWIETTVMPVLVPGGYLVYLGNTWHQDDVVSKFMNDPRFIVAKRQGAIIREADRQDLWQKWASFLLNISVKPKERFSQADAFYEENRVEMDKGWKVLWRERYPYSRLYLERLLNPYTFARMYQCFTPDTLIRTSKGLKQIKDIRVGDSVLTHKGRLRPVLKTMVRKGDGKIYSIKVRGFYDSIRVTGEHPILTSKGWVKASKLKVYDEVCMPKQKGDNQFSVGVLRAYIYGWYLAEGSIGVHGRMVTFSLATKEKNNIQQLCDALTFEGFKPKVNVMKNERSCTNISICSKTLADELVGLFGKVKGKHIPEIVFDMPELERRQILHAYLLGDGYETRIGRYRVSSVCLDLSDGIARIAESIGYDVTKRYFRPRKDSKIGDRVIKTNGFDHVLNIYDHVLNTYNVFCPGEDYLSHRIEKVSIEYYYDNLYNLEVAEDNSYCLAHFAAHNCDPSNRPDQVIRDEWIEAALKKGKHLRFQDGPHDKNHLKVSAAGMDLAISMEEAADDTCLLYLDLVFQGYDGVDDGDYIIRQIHRGKYTPNEQRTKAKVAWSNHGMETIRVESVGYQAALAIDLENEGVNVRSYHTGKEKFDPDIGINSLAAMMESGKLVIPSDPTDARTIMLASKLANEMRAFPDGHTGDSLMALWFAYSEVRELMGDRPIMASSQGSRIKDSPPLQRKEQRIEFEKEADAELIRIQEKERSGFDRMLTTFGKKE